MLCAGVRVLCAGVRVLCADVEVLCAGMVVLCWCWVLCVCVLGEWSTSCDAASVGALQCCLLVNVWNGLYQVCVYDPINNLMRCSVYRLW